MKITFEGEFLSHLIAEAALFVAAFKEGAGLTVASPSPDEAPAEPKKTRRSPKAKADDTDTTEKPKRTRKAAEPKAEEKPKRTRKAKPAEDEGITDEDMSKAASTLAESHGPNVVTDLLAQFEVGDVSDIEQAERQEFLDIAMADD